MKHDTLDHVQLFERDARATALVAHTIAFDRHLCADPGGTLRRCLGDSFQWIQKSAVAAVTPTDLATALAPLNAAFIGATNAASLLGPLLAAGARTFGLAQGGRLQVLAVEARDVAEGATKPVMTLEFELDTSTPTKLEAAAVFTADALRSMDLTTVTGVQQVLVGACAARTDRFIVDTLVAAAGSPTSGSVGDLLSSLSEGRASAPMLLGSLAGLLTLDPGTLRDLRDLGVTVATCAAADDTLIGLDATGVLVADGGVEVSIAQHASMFLDNGDSPVSETLVSLWQSNLTALRAERWLRLAVRADAVAYLALEP